VTDQFLDWAIDGGLGYIEVRPARGLQAMIYLIPKSGRAR
jgi:hypothetical protein